jgi:hypothetical protein
MDRLTETATSGNHSVGSTAVTIFSNQVRTNSVFVKKGNVRYIQLISNAFSDSSCSAIFDLDTKTVTNFRASSAAGPIFAYVNSGVEDYGNGILRLFLTNTSTFDNTTFHINHSNVATFAAGTLTDGFITYSGSASSFTDLWGAQVEVGSYVSSYIPTLGSSVTRLADTASKTGISSLIGQASGTIYTEVTFGDNPTGMFFLSLVGSVWTSDAIYLEKNGSGFIQISSVQGGVGVGSTASTILAAPKTKAKIAGQYSGGTFNLYVNGIKFSGTRTANALCSGLYFNQIGTLSDSGNFQENLFGSVALFTTALSDSECIALTTL